MIEAIQLAIIVHLGCFAIVVFLMAYEQNKHRKK
jgi:hypothetical protein